MSTNTNDNNTAPMTVHNFDIKNIIPQKLEENERSNNQLMGYIRDDKNEQIMFQTCVIVISDRGMPGYHKQFYDTFDKRAYILLPLDVNQNPNIQKLIDAMVSIDERFNSSETRSILFAASKQECEEWEYQDIVRDSAPGKDGRERPPYMKIKLDTVYDEELIRTLLVDSNDNVIQASRSSSLNEEQLYNIDEFANYIKFRSKIKLLITPCKVWTISQKMGKKTVKNYGITWKAKQIMTSPPQYTKSNMTRSIFIPDDEDDISMGPSDISMGPSDIVLGNNNDDVEGSSMVDTITASMGSLITPSSIQEPNVASTSPSEDIGDSDSSDDEITIKKPVKKSKSKTKTKGM